MIKLKKTYEFKNVYNNGCSLANKYLILYYYKNNLNYNRVGYSISKKIGKSVIRNHVRRLMNESLRLMDSKLNTGYDMVFIARTKIIEADFHMINNAIKMLLKRTPIMPVKKR
ncbi:MAG: ribonuclease P protein component [Thermoanaerobacteraceae bacterium]|nr:ribonuclease P protein component [Thermoanaerobacteraceae bacterium]